MDFRIVQTEQDAIPSAKRQTSSDPGIHKLLRYLKNLQTFGQVIA
jgi:hypothetical protein